MTLDEFKALATKKLEQSRSPEEVTSVLSEVKFSLHKMGFSLPIQSLFWNLLQGDLGNMQFADGAVKVTAIKIVQQNIKSIITDM
jgi:hypothetical protein